ncbi:nicotinamide-nucleotide amidohydrolase family protein [Candidatus Amarolinea aalborgensis]|uniref:nicotinamide-nucleotide amidohydrolase family protein n=1 Tax=Candidatus Amarolinea aalborgensis TaxID=2249329 RepID=UPI003BFA168F
MSEEDIEIKIGGLLSKLGLTLALAESCTGGQIGNRLTDVAGSSAYFLGSAVTYAYSAKEHVLGVDHNTLLSKGAVSAEVARQMAHGARRVFGADIAVSVTGIAGPGGGTPDKPVGLAHLHLSAPDAEWAERHVWQEDRVGNKRLSANAALALILRYLEQQVQEAGEKQQMAAGKTGSRAGGEESRQPGAAVSPSMAWTAVAVDAWRTPDGQVHPRAFAWRGEMHVVTAVGRRWVETTEDAPWHCVLVQTALGDTFELRYQPNSDRWMVSGTWLRPRLA